MEDKTVKRSYALPIALMLLVFSAIGNVFLYSQVLQHKQEDSYSRGEKIFLAATEAHSFTRELREHVSALIVTNNLSDRAEIKFRTGAAYRYAEGLNTFILEGQRLEGGGEDVSGVQNPKLFLDDVQKALLNIGNHEGALTEEERAYLIKLDGVLGKLNVITSQFNFDGTSKSALIRSGNGYDWPELSKKLLQAMNDEKSMAFS
ncbi:hypothetical protein ACFO9Q_17185 [Paenibacillus sp. GCM10023252]|uniref:hypothetical protein n=1 Tax=Paenibacillus sp. GCM10023252 TaxID=3252649 RepID=UPI003614BEF6